MFIQVSQAKADDGQRSMIFLSPDMQSTFNGSPLTAGGD